MAKFVSETFELGNEPVKVIEEADLDLMVFLSASSASVRIGYGPNNVAALFLGLKDQMIQLTEGRELWAVSIGGETQTLGVYAFPN